MGKKAHHFERIALNQSKEMHLKFSLYIVSIFFLKPWKEEGEKRECKQYNARPNEPADGRRLNTEVTRARTSLVLLVAVNNSGGDGSRWV